MGKNIDFKEHVNKFQERERSKNLFQNFMNELEKDIDLAGILQNDRIKEEYSFQILTTCLYFASVNNCIPH